MGAPWGCYTLVSFPGATHQRSIRRAALDVNALFNRGIVKWQGKLDAKGATADWKPLLKQNPNLPQAGRVKMLIAQASKHANVNPGQKSEKPGM